MCFIDSLGKLQSKQCKISQALHMRLISVANFMAGLLVACGAVVPFLHHLWLGLVPLGGMHICTVCKVQLSEYAGRLAGALLEEGLPSKKAKTGMPCELLV